MTANSPPQAYSHRQDGRLRLRVLIYGDDPDIGGAAYCTHRLAMKMAEHGYQVSFAQTRKDAARIAARTEAGIDHFFLPYHTMDCFHLATRDRQYPAAIIQQSAPDLIIFADSVSESTLAAKDVAHGLGVPFVTIKHSVIATNPSTQVPAVRAAIGRACALAQQIVIVSEAAKAELVQAFDVDAAKVTVIPNWCEERFFTPRSPDVRARLRREWGIPESTFVVMTVGNASMLKGTDIILSAMNYLRSHHSLDDMAFVWIGGGGRDYFDKMNASGTFTDIKPYLHILDPRTDIPDCLDAADAFLLPSRSESFGLALLEAMAKGVPVLSTRVGGIPETVGDCGVLVCDPSRDQPRTEMDIADTLTQWRRQPAIAADLGARGAERARHAFDEATLFDRFCALVDAAVFPENDYVSPGFAIIKPDRRFPFLVTLDERFSTTGRRRALHHNRYADGRDVHRIIPNRDEAILLYNLARPFAGKPGLLLGADMGWAAVHVLAAGVDLDIVDPHLAEPDRQASVIHALRDLPARLHIGWGEGAVRHLAERNPHPWAFVLFNLATPESARDLPAVLDACERHAAADAMLVIANLLWSGFIPLLLPLQARGWRITLYDTAQMVAVATRGSAAAVPHQPDPAAQWLRPYELKPEIFAVAAT